MLNNPKSLDGYVINITDGKVNILLCSQCVPKEMVAFQHAYTKEHAHRPAHTRMKKKDARDGKALE